MLKHWEKNSARKMVREVLSLLLYQQCSLCSEALGYRDAGTCLPQV